MKIYWKDQLAYDEKDNFLAIIHEMPNNQFCVFLNHQTDELDYRQLDIRDTSLEIVKEKTEIIFHEIQDISEIENLLTVPFENRELPTEFLNFLSEFAIHGS